MAKSSAAAVKELRELTGMGMMDCKKILDECAGDFEKARKMLEEKGKTKVVKLAARAATEGIVEFYLHHDGKLGVMVELNCNTDFVARNDDFRTLAKGLALHIAALDPMVVKREDLDQALVDSIRANCASDIPGNKPPEVIEKIVDGKMKTWFEERVLLDQIYVKDESKSKTIRQVLEETTAKTGENVTLRRFARFKVGEGMATPEAE